MSGVFLAPTIHAMSEVRQNVIERYAARVVLLDADDRVLLFRCKDPAADRSFWITPGGGLEGDESHEQAAERELYEETGLTGVPIGPCVWTRSHSFPWSGKMYCQHERFFMVRVEGHDVDVSSHTEEECVALTEHRWWSAQAVQQATDETFAPRRLGVLMASLIAGMPGSPIDVGV